ncbi:EamA family transporter [Falsibacillus albus]|uniref:DMT family transporter n=1 Tax=Falsibacillus albus TaxID=2478915 RepID=A0A3L7K158_9BACI|nr:DMT family transporter [Falsibacillus albus]RLQ96325.1 DMT family transporter [Falsibacillus albus]
MKIKFGIAVLVGSCSYGILSTIVKISYKEGIPPEIVTIGQFFSGWLILQFLMIMNRDLEKLKWKERLQLMLAGVPTGLVGIFYYLSLQTVSASLGIILLFQFTWMGILLNSLLQKRLPNLKTIFTLAMLLIGTFLASGTTGNSLEGGIIDGAGLMLGLAAAISFTLFIHTNAHIFSYLPSIQRSYHMVTGSFLIVIIIFSPSLMHPNTAQFINLGTKGVLLGIFGVVIPPVLFAYGMPRIGSVLGSILGAAELPVAVLLSMVVLHEKVSFFQWIGVFIILFSIASPYLKLETLKVKNLK